MKKETQIAKTRDSSMRDETVPVVLIRHAQSQWNRENRFTGWANPLLTDAGIAEAIQAGVWLRINGFRFDVAFSSRLQRAVTTLDILLEKIGPPQLFWRYSKLYFIR